ncbi:farnesol dehydrogenase-like [Chelonus insularis]|uniref:farnesol dehydrogenase-like n=1 Tax=Chelonus insularis TaxID=460826 RepID=UPI001588AC71|nr:farnesol dehydrogenase-like [Chelonus insularis]
MDRWAGKLAIVTGASAGIGEATAKALVIAGVNVLGLARGEEKLKKLQNSLTGCRGSFYYMKCDVRNEKDILNAFKYADEKLGGVNILINNAGIVKAALFDALKTDEIHAVTDINLIAPVICIREALKSLRKHKREGHIININSLAGLNATIIDPLPINIYPATKFGLRAIAQNVRAEIAKAKDKIRLTTIYPGAVKTEINTSSGVDPTILNSIMPEVLRSEDIANAVIYALSAPPHVQIEDLAISGF